MPLFDNTTLSAPWRLLLATGDEARSGAENMALDSELARFASPAGAPVLRLYQWRPWAISLGYHQRLQDINVDRCRADGIDVVRRPTGGRAILHAEELTYCVVLPRQCGIPVRSTAQTYRLISEALVWGLRLLGADLRFDRSSRSSYRAEVPCFATTAMYEVQWQGRKVIGSAQRRFRNAVLQHGSILLGDAHLRLADYLRLEDSPGLRQRLQHALRVRTATLAEAAGRALQVDEVVEAILEGFRAVLGADFSDGFDALTLVRRDEMASSNRGGIG